jgi:hypothetical protein
VGVKKRRFINAAMYVVLAFWCVSFIRHDRALLSALLTALLVGNLTFDFVNWTERRS